MKDLKWKTLSSEYLFDDLWFRVRKDICLTPGGKKVDPYYVYEFPNWVSALPVLEDGRVLMVRQYRQALGETCLEIPGGCVDPEDKDFQSAIERELMEETGHRFSQYDYLGKISSNPSTNNNLMHMFLARGGKKVADQQLDANEEIELEFYSLKEIRQMILENKIIQSMHVCCILYALEKMKAGSVYL
ncbi:MAG TPA: NUDIX hydrolase [Chitinophagaceae bacterium]|nr:NUDIX hydrolase [Chitinophagaceae bacterium]